MATPEVPLQLPTLRSYTQPFHATDSIHILGTDHGLSPVTLASLIVQVYEVPEDGGMSVLMPPTGYEYILDVPTQDVLVTLRQPATGSVLLTVMGPPVPVDLTALPTMPPVPPPVEVPAPGSSPESLCVPPPETPVAAPSPPKEPPV